MSDTDVLLGLRDGLRRFLAGDYPSPRSKQCLHGKGRSDECELCNEAFIRELLDAYQPEVPRPSLTRDGVVAAINRNPEIMKHIAKTNVLWATPDPSATRD